MYFIPLFSNNLQNINNRPLSKRVNSIYNILNPSLVSLFNNSKHSCQAKNIIPQKRLHLKKKKYTHTHTYIFERAPVGKSNNSNARR